MLIRSTLCVVVVFLKSQSRGVPLPAPHFFTPLFCWRNQVSCTECSTCYIYLFSSLLGCLICTSILHISCNLLKAWLGSGLTIVARILKSWYCVFLSASHPDHWLSLLPSFRNNCDWLVASRLPAPSCLCQFSN